mmetsp:Transcript_7469/g.24598  ORF Transcript_7469/g.24598 Transcript_7469/m.24598 type:complete len:174 (+) Transcript_7469:113-634(+)
MRGLVVATLRTPPLLLLSAPPEAPWLVALARRVADQVWLVAEEAAAAVASAEWLSEATAEAVRRELGRVAETGDGREARALAAAALRDAPWDSERASLQRRWQLAPQDQLNAELERRGLRSRVSEAGGGGGGGVLSSRPNGSAARAVAAIVDDERRRGTLQAARLAEAARPFE